MNYKISKWISLFFDIEEEIILKSINNITIKDNEIITLLVLPGNQKIEVIFSKKNNININPTNYKKHPVIIIYLTTNQKELIKEKHFEDVDIYILNIKRCLKLKNQKETIKSPKINNLIELSILLKKKNDKRKNDIMNKKEK